MQQLRVRDEGWEGSGRCWDDESLRCRRLPEEEVEYTKGGAVGTMKETRASGSCGESQSTARRVELSLGSGHCKFRDPQTGKYTPKPSRK